MLETYTVLHEYRRFSTWQYRFPSAVIPFPWVCTCGFSVPLHSYRRYVISWQQFALHRSVARVSGWSMVLEMGSGFGCWVLQAHPHVPAQDAGQGSAACSPPAFIVPLRSRERAPPKMSLNGTVVAAVSQLYTGNHVSCYRRGSVCTHEKLAFICQIARNLLW